MVQALFLSPPPQKLGHLQSASLSHILLEKQTIRKDQPHSWSNIPSCFAYSCPHLRVESCSYSTGFEVPGSQPQTLTHDSPGKEAEEQQVSPNPKRRGEIGDHSSS